MRSIYLLTANVVSGMSDISWQRQRAPPLTSIFGITEDFFHRVIHSFSYRIRTRAFRIHSLALLVESDMAEEIKASGKKSAYTCI